ncbi:dolichyl-phosphate mannose synthase [Brachyspira sp. G79]|uniref:dolichyl-phosphate mannose synthase n=1 Tax=Brachyspira sp. G79 TaxID=1358104 RepID=UPI000BBC2BD0|nr:dolichyl-phosphate mannose synthase [Brachyspira sp. G79]
MGGSHKVAFNYAIENNYDYIIVLHGDDQGSIKDIVPYIKDKSAFNYDAFLGARFMKGSKTPGYDKIRIIGNYAVNTFISIFLRKNIKDMGSGLNMIKVEILKNKFYLPFRNDLTFNVYLLFYLIHAKTNFLFFPLTWREDDQISNAKVFKQGIHIIKMTFKYVFNAKKLLTEENAINNFEYNIIYKN